MQICSNCKTPESVTGRKLGESNNSRDQREWSYASTVDFCHTCWELLRSDKLQQFHDRFMPLPGSYVMD